MGYTDVRGQGSTGDKEEHTPRPLHALLPNVCAHVGGGIPLTQPAP